MAPLDGISQLAKSKRVASSFPSERYRTSQERQLEDESSMPLLSHAMADDKVKSSSPVIDAVGSESDSTSPLVSSKYEKAPWWSYIWVRQIPHYCEIETNFFVGL